MTMPHDGPDSERAPYSLTVAGASRRLRHGSLSATELTTATLERIEATEPFINAFITVTADAALDQAARADRERSQGLDRGPLHGIPIGIKDLIDVEGVVTTAGSSFLRNVATRDAHVVSRLREAGAVLVGKLNTHEFAMGATNINPHHGDACNPWDVERVTGGSSGGSGAAVAAGSCLAALGTDTGGSIRIPAALCGVTGLLPTTGRVSRSGVFPLAATLDHVGPLARSVEDCALVLAAIAGYDPDDPLSADMPLTDWRPGSEGLEGVRIGVAQPFWEDCDPGVAARCAEALDVLRELGAAVIDVELPVARAAGRPSLALVELFDVHKDWCGASPEHYGDDVRGLVEVARSGVYDRDAELRVQADLLRESTAVLEEVDVLVSPTTPRTAPTRREGDPTYSLARDTSYHDVTGLPAISVPCGLADGLPVGLTIAGRHFDEAMVLRVGHAYESAVPWRAATDAMLASFPRAR